MPKSLVSAILKADMFIPALAKRSETSFSLPDLFSRNTESCFIIMVVFFYRKDAKAQS
jgi:hypothetical protein